MKGATFNFPDGRQLVWHEVGQGRPLVMLHGWAMSAAVFSEIVPLLSTEFRLLIPDLPGHGGSSPALLNDFSGLASDLERWLAETCKGPVSLFGWSLGGMLSLQLAHHGRLPIDNLVLAAVTPRFTQNKDWSFGLPPVQLRALARNLERRFEATLADFFSLAFAGENLSRERLREIKKFAVQQSSLPDRTAALNLLDLLMAQDQRAILPDIHQPALLLHGDLDQIAPVSAGRFMADKLPYGCLFELPGVGHAPFLSLPKECAARILEFL